MTFSNAVSVLAALFLTACTAATPAPPQASPPDNQRIVHLPAPPPPPPHRLDAAIDAGLHFLEGQYNAELGLLQESPHIGAHRYFLANDALLAAHVFETMGREDLAAALRATLEEHDIAGNGFIEVAWGESIPWPPLHFEDPGTRVEVQGDAEILTIIHDGPGYFYDWSAYSNLAFMAALNELNQGYAESAARLFTIQMGTFDGYGFPDKAYHDRIVHNDTEGLAISAPTPNTIQPEERSIIWERIDVDIKILTDGTFEVDENQTVRFVGGSFSEGFAEIFKHNLGHISDWHITDSQGIVYEHVPSVSAPYTFMVEETADMYTVVWRFPPIADETATFSLSYRVHDALRYYEDGDQLWWRAIVGDRVADVVEGQVRAVIPLEASVQEWAAYINGRDAHEAVTATVDQSGQAVLFNLNQPLLSGEELEVRVEFTPGVVEGAVQPWQQPADEAAASREAEVAYHNHDGVYETLGLAFGALAAANLCGELTLDSRALIDQLLAQQSPETGGFHTHFRADANQLADANVETTSVALLALHALAQGDCLPSMAER